VVGVSILVEQAGQPAPHKAEVSWTIETGRIDSGWRKLEGRRFDEASNTYVEEHIEGWLVRLDSVDAQSAGGDPAAITVSFKPAP